MSRMHGGSLPNVNQMTAAVSSMNDVQSNLLSG